VSSLNPHSINGLNLYCYANNNPIRSTVLNSYNFNTTSNYVAFANKFIKTDINSAGIENKNNWFMIYRGVPVFIIPEYENLGSFSFGFIFLE